ncbi:glutamate carboxypeptidase 2 [Clonorchis sinensis]|uniref:Glutamate carboxypeptidase 2 n=1 Tax=Clonorchis sinensis TaxID=79923 RepID=G7YCL7_CLOSI|nr:glutamate carboxypeptidase 2 [Clonorchis sinensis]
MAGLVRVCLRQALADEFVVNVAYAGSADKLLFRYTRLCTLIEAGQQVALALTLDSAYIDVHCEPESVRQYSAICSLGFAVNGDLDDYDDDVSETRILDTSSHFAHCLITFLPSDDPEAAEAGYEGVGIVPSRRADTHAFRIDTDWKELARQLYKQVSPNFLQEQLRTFAGGQPHPPGTIANRILGERIASDWESWHIPIVRREEFFVTLPLGPSPSGPLNEVILTDAAGSKVIFEAKNYGIPLDLVTFDKTQGRQKGQPSLLCSGKLTAIARLQKTTRQSKIRALFTHCDCGPDGSPVPGHHPSALILYPDPQDTVSPHHPVYPDGPGLPGDSPVFGHLCMSHGGGGNPGAPHLPSSIHTYETHEMMPGKALTSIPVQPISYNDAAVILSHLSGAELPEEWSGCLATHLGPSHDSMLRVTVNNRVSPERIPLLNVLGIIPGSTDESDHYVIFGNHRDAWVQGACDPGSGTIILQQLAKLLGSAYKEGFRPRRTLVLASWDGEELSLLGSTHEVEQRCLELGRRAVAYINADCPVKGHTSFVARTDTLLADTLLTASRLVQVDPPANTTIWLHEWLKQEGKSLDSEPCVTPPGTGSDHIPFSYKLGVPSSYPGFTPDDGLAYPPIYHTAYDIISVAERFTDPAVSDTGPMPRHRLLVRLYLTMILQLCCASRLPYSICRWATTFSKEWEKFKQFAVSKVPKLTGFGVNLDWISEDLDQMLHSAERVDAFLNTLEQRTTEFPTVLNRTVANIPKCFVKPSLTDPDLFPFVLYAPRGFQTVYFHRIQSAFTRFLKHIHDNNSEEKFNCLRLLKQELSILASCINEATECMRNGLVGFEGLA